MSSPIDWITRSCLLRRVLMLGVAGACALSASHPAMAVDSGTLDLNAALFPGQESIDEGITWQIYKNGAKCSLLYDPGPGKHAAHKEKLSGSRLQIELETGNYCVEVRFNSRAIQPGRTPIVLRSTDVIEVVKDKNTQKVIALNPAGLRITYTPFRFPDALPSRENPSVIQILLKPDEFPEKGSSLQQRLVDTQDQQPLGQVRFDMAVSTTAETQRTFFVNSGKHTLTAHANYGGHLSQALIAKTDALKLPPAEVEELLLSAPVGLLKPAALAKKPAKKVFSRDVSNLLVPIEYRIYPGTGDKPEGFELEFDNTGRPKLLITARITRKRDSELYRHDIRYRGGHRHVRLEKHPVPVLALASGGTYLVEAKRTPTPWHGQAVASVSEGKISEPEVEVAMGTIVLSGGIAGPCARFAGIRTAVYQPSNSLHGRRHLGTTASAAVIELMADVDYELEYTMHSMFGTRKLSKVSINEATNTDNPKTGTIAANTRNLVNAKFPDIACAQLKLVGVFGRQNRKKARWDFFDVTPEQVKRIVNDEKGKPKEEDVKGVFNYSRGKPIVSVHAVSPRIVHQLGDAAKEGQDFLAVVTVGRHKYSGYFKMKANTLTQARVGKWQTEFVPLDKLMSLGN